MTRTVAKCYCVYVLEITLLKYLKPWNNDECPYPKKSVYCGTSQAVVQANQELLATRYTNNQSSRSRSRLLLKVASYVCWFHTVRIIAKYALCFTHSYSAKACLQIVRYAQAFSHLMHVESSFVWNLDWICIDLASVIHFIKLAYQDDIRKSSSGELYTIHVVPHKKQGRLVLVDKKFDVEHGLGLHTHIK